MPTCPDCAVEMEETEHTSSYQSDRLRIKTGGGILGALDAKGQFLTCYVCPECKLARFYAD